MKRALVLGTLVAAGLLAIAVQGQQPRPPVNPLLGQVRAIQKITDALYFIPGAGGNSAVFIRADGVLLVDTKVPDNGQKLLDEIKKVTDKPLTHIINTHKHTDHTGSNSFFPARIEIIAHENTKASMQKDPAFQSAEGKVGLPDRTFKDRMTLFSGKDAVDLYYFGPAHTNGDILIRFREARVLHAGDMFALKTSPLVDVESGGSVVQYGETMAKAVRGITDVDRVLTGHGELRAAIEPKMKGASDANVVPWQEFVDYGEFNRIFAAYARESLKAGKTAEQALKDFKPPAKFVDYVLAPPRPPSMRPYPGVNFGIAYEEIRNGR